MRLDVVRALLAALVLLLTTSACTSDPEPPARAAPVAADSDPAPRVLPGDTLEPLGEVRLGRVVGRLDAAQRQRVLAEVTEVVDAWLWAAYLGDPRRDRVTWPGFTAEARRLARRDQDLTSSAGLGPGIRTIDPRARDVKVDVLVAGGWAQAATARVHLVARARGQRPRRVVVRGQAYLTQRAGTWRVFGYDVSRGVR